MDPVSPSSYRYASMLWMQQEWFYKYSQGGLHPVSLGDTFKDGRYKIVHKLGWGGFSTVWLARDREREQWVSLKILTADATTRCKEAQMLQSLQRDDPMNHVVRLLDSFIHTGPNGTHRCLVLELLGPNLDYIIRTDYLENDKFLLPETILKIAKQLLEGLAFVHKAGYAHGDLGGHNVAFAMSCAQGLSEEELFEHIGAPETEELVPINGEPLHPGVPRHLVRATEWDLWMEEDEEDIRLIDWGEAFAQGSEPASVAQPPGLTAPESIFTSRRADHRIDLWCTGSLIYKLVFNTEPLVSWSRNALVSHMINFVEDFPAEWRPQWEEMKRSSPQDELVEETQGLPRLEQEFRDKVHEEKLQVLLPVIRGLMRFFPEDRITAVDALALLEG